MTLTSDDLKSITNRMGILKLVENDTSNVFLCYLVPKLGPFEYYTLLHLGFEPKTRLSHERISVGNFWGYNMPSMNPVQVRMPC